MSVIKSVGATESVIYLCIC